MLRAFQEQVLPQFNSFGTAEKVMIKRAVGKLFLLHEIIAPSCFSIYQNAANYVSFDIEYNVLLKQCI